MSERRQRRAALSFDPLTLSLSLSIARFLFCRNRCLSPTMPAAAATTAVVSAARRRSNRTRTLVQVGVGAAAVYAMYKLVRKGELSKLVSPRHSLNTTPWSPYQWLSTPRALH
jgi:hypothetical protein